MTVLPDRNHAWVIAAFHREEKSGREFTLLAKSVPPSRVAISGFKNGAKAGVLMFINSFFLPVMDLLQKLSLTKISGQLVEEPGQQGGHGLKRILNEVVSGERRNDVVSALSICEPGITSASVFVHAVHITTATMAMERFFFIVVSFYDDGYLMKQSWLSSSGEGIVS